MAKQSVATSGDQSSKPAMKDFCTDVEWDSLKGLHAGVTNRLKRADRAIFAASCIATMLDEDRRAKDDAEHNAGVTYEGLAPVNVEALHLALIDLSELSGRMLEEVRSNCYGCVTGENAS